jgi:hypothetical protein
MRGSLSPKAAGDSLRELDMGKGALTNLDFPGWRRFRVLDKAVASQVSAGQGLKAVGPDGRKKGVNTLSSPGVGATSTLLVSPNSQRSTPKESLWTASTCPVAMRP